MKKGATVHICIARERKRERELTRVDKEKLNEYMHITYLHESHPLQQQLCKFRLIHYDYSSLFFDLFTDGNSININRRLHTYFTYPRTYQIINKPKDHMQSAAMLTWNLRSS
jgi:hypothetical protein